MTKFFIANINGKPTVVLSKYDDHAREEFAKHLQVEAHDLDDLREWIAANPDAD